MTVVVGYRPGFGGEEALELGIAMAGSLDLRLEIVIALPRPWTTPSMAKVDAEFASYAARLGEESERAAHAALSRHSVTAPVGVHRVTERSVSVALTKVSGELEAQFLVMGTRHRTRGGFSLGSTTSRMIHSSEIPLALAPPDYIAPPGGLSGVTCAYSATADGTDVVAGASTIASSAGVRLRVASFGVAPADMYPPEVGLDAERGVLAAWVDQTTAAQSALRTSGLIDPSVATVIGTGADYTAALAAIDWPAGEVLAIGTTPRSPVKRVFLGSTATRILGGATVPVIVLPG
ncbi:universal stress protein [Williamsia phyllosphaerae]|uniref:Universal stress protein n=1 Tax=Williamsia phyllosphaerae TaxID=885042 RepID=A0ABQ1URG6_9NOCA|nr:universal stress protein [Williamsia phyllosphaerae]GGF24422.1 universal stress protein [Williamsia phyllosphaerae]